MTFSVSLVSLRDKGEGGSKIAMTAEGASIYDVRKTFGFFYHPPSSEFYVLFVRKFGVFFYPPLPPLSGRHIWKPPDGKFEGGRRREAIKWKMEKTTDIGER